MNSLIAPRVEFRQEHHLRLLYLGEIVVGRVLTDGGKRNRPRWMFDLQTPCRNWVSANTVEEAELTLLGVVREWLARAGLQGDGR